MSNNMIPNRPIQKFEIFPVICNVWKNGDFYNVTVQRAYKHQESGKWRFTPALRAQDLLTAAELLRQAQWYINDLQQMNRKIRGKQEDTRLTERAKMEEGWDEEDLGAPF